MSSLPHYRVFENPDQLAEAAADFVQREINDCLKQQPCCHIALPGGNTPAGCLQKLSTRKLPWQSIKWFMGDERCLPEGHAERNDTMIMTTLFAQDAAEYQHFFYPISAEKGPEKAAQEYTDRIHSFDAFDIILLGMGEDGHTASLFPGNLALTDKRAVVPVFDAPKPPPQRVSLGLPALQSARCRIVLVTGTGKNAALNKIKNGKQLPVNCIGDNHWFVDKAADAGSDC